MLASHAPPPWASEPSRKPREVLFVLAMAAGLGAGAGMPPATAYADRLTLAERSDGSEVEVLEEQPDAFVVKIPKSEVTLIKRETPTEVKLWKEKKILWEDQGDYVVISLPKERITPPSNSDHGAAEYATAPTLTEGLAATGATGRTSRLGVLTGDVTGRVLRGSRPLAGCRVKLVAIQGPSAELSRLLGGGTRDGKTPTTREAMTGANGVYLFEHVPIGDYDISWLPPGSTHWLGRLSEVPDVTVRAEEVAQQGDVDL